MLPFVVASEKSLRLGTEFDGYAAVLPFSKANKTFFGYFDPENYFLDCGKKSNFRGDLTDNSAKKDALVCSGELPSQDYVKLLSRSENGGCPALFLAPMENLADRPFRMAHSRTVCGFDEACTEFIRVPNNTAEPFRFAKGLAKCYNAKELGNVPLAAQIMGNYLPIMEFLVPRLVDQGAPRIDLNCGCPASGVTGKGAGSRYENVNHLSCIWACRCLALEVAAFNSNNREMNIIRLACSYCKSSVLRSSASFFTGVMVFTQNIRYLTESSTSFSKPLHQK